MIKEIFGFFEIDIVELT